MTNSNEDLEIKAAWLYYVNNLGQEAIASRLNISRSKVVRTLSSAREKGFIKILVEHKTTETLALSDWIANKFNVRECLMTPYLDTRTTDSAINERLGRQAVEIVAANHVGRRLQNAVSITVGIGAGKTLAEMIVSLPAMAKDDLRIASLLGASTFDDGNSCYSLTLRLAGVTGGRAHTLPVPLSVADPSTRRALESDRSVLRTLEIARAADVKFLGCSDCLEGNTFFRSMQLERADIHELTASGAVLKSPGSSSTRRARWRRPS